MRIEFNGNTYDCFSFFVVYLKRNINCFTSRAQIMFKGYQAALNWIKRHEHDADKFIVQVYALTNTRDVEIIYLCDLGGERASMVIAGGLLSPKHDVFRISYEYAASILAPWNLDVYIKDKPMLKRRLNSKKSLNNQIAYYERKKNLINRVAYLDERHKWNQKRQNEINELRANGWK